MLLEREQHQSNLSKYLKQTLEKNEGYFAMWDRIDSLHWMKVGIVTARFFRVLMYHVLCRLAFAAIDHESRTKSSSNDTVNADAIL